MHFHLLWCISPLSRAYMLGRAELRSWHYHVFAAFHGAFRRFKRSRLHLKTTKGRLHLHCARRFESPLFGIRPIPQGVPTCYHFMNGLILITPRLLEMQFGDHFRKRDELGKLATLESCWSFIKLDKKRRQEVMKSRKRTMKLFFLPQFRKNMEFFVFSLSCKGNFG